MFIVQHLKTLMSKHKSRNTEVVREITKVNLMKEYYELQRKWDELIEPTTLSLT